VLEPAQVPELGLGLERVPVPELAPELGLAPVPEPGLAPRKPPPTHSLGPPP